MLHDTYADYVNNVASKRANLEDIVVFSPFNEGEVESNIHQLVIRNGEVFPRISLVSPFQPINIKCQDERDHNVRLIGSLQPQSARPITLDKRSFSETVENCEVFVKVVCDIHPEEVGFLAVIKKFQGVKCDPQGQFTVLVPMRNDVSTLIAAHPDFGQSVVEWTHDTKNIESTTVVIRMIGRTRKGENPR